MELDQVDSKGRRWRRFRVSGHEFHVNMSVLEPYLQVLSHGGEMVHQRRKRQDAGDVSSDQTPLLVRLLWRRDERHHPFHLLLSAREHGGGLRLCHGEPVQVRCVRCSLSACHGVLPSTCLLQVHRWDFGPDGFRELHAGLPVQPGSQKQTTYHQVAPSVLHLH